MSMWHMPAQLILDLAESVRCGEEHQLAEVGDSPVLEREEARGEAEERRLDNLYTQRAVCIECHRKVACGEHESY